MAPREAAAYLGLSVDAIYDACALKGLKHSKLGHATMRLRREWLDEWVEANARGGRDESTAGDAVQTARPGLPEQRRAS